MNEQGWIKSIFEYGPYAVLVFFALWVGPRQTNLFLKCDRGDKGARLFTGSIAGGCWMVTVLMAWFIYTNWSSKTVYTGSFGIHKDYIGFISADRNLYISSEPVGNRLKWNFAVVADATQQKASEGYAFSLTWGKGDEHYRDYIISSEYLKKGYKFEVAKDDPTLLLYDHDNNPGTPMSPLTSASTESAPGSWGVAYAQEDKGKDFVEALASPNKHIWAHARKQLREMGDTELKGLLEKHPDLPEIARDRVNEELERRAEKSSN